MGTRILGVAAAVASFSLNAILQLFDAQGWTMPDWLGVVLLVALILFGAIAVLIVLNELRKGAAWLFGQLHFRSPVVLGEAIDPHQSLLDLANEDAAHPAAHLLILKAEFTNKNLAPDEFRPWVQIGLTIRNVGIHSILVGGAEGHALYKRRQLPDEIEGQSGLSRMPRDHEQAYNLKQYLPPEIAEELFKDMCGERHRVGSLGLSGVKIKVTSEAENGPQGWLSLSRVSFIEVPD